MNFFKLIKGNWIANIAVWLILLIPFIYIPFLMFPSTSGKMLVFLSTVSILIFGILISGDSFKIQKIRHPIILALVVLWLVTLLSTIFSINPWLSFWGNISRASGFIVITGVFLTVLLIVNRINRLQVYKILSILSVIGGLTGLYAIAQKIGISNLLLFKLTLLNSSSRVDATFGNPLFLGSFLLITIFISLFWVINSVYLKTKIFHGTLLAFQIVALLMTASRGPFLGLIIGLIIFGFFYLRNIIKWSPNTKKIIIKTILAIVVSMVLVFVFRQPLGIARLFDIGPRLIEGTVQQRLLTYEAVIKSVPDRPLLGYGIDNVYVAFDRNYNPKLSSFGYGETFFDRAHNIFIDQLATTGILGLIALLMLGVIIIYYLLRLLRTAKERRDKLVSIMFIGMLVAYVVQGLTSFDIITNFIYGGILLALVVVLVSKNEEKETIVKSQGLSLLYFGRVILGLAFLAPIVIWYSPTYNSSGLVSLALAQQRHGQYVKADINYATAIELNSPYTHEMVAYAYTDHVKNYSNYNDVRGQEGIARQILFDGIQVLEKMAEREPQHLQIKSFLASLNVMLSIYDTESTRGQELFEELTNDHPDRLFLFLNWGKYLIAAKQPAIAIEKLEHALTIPIATAEIDMWLGIANTITNINDNRAVIMLHNAAEKKLTGSIQVNQILVDMIIELLVAKEQWQDAIYYRKWGIDNNSKNAEAMANLSVLYKENKQYIQAKSTAEEMAELFPDYRQNAIDFINSLPTNPTIPTI